MSVHFDDDVYIIEEHQLVLPITVIAERPALVEYDVLVHPIVTGSNATGLSVMDSNYKCLIFDITSKA